MSFKIISFLGLIVFAFVTCKSTNKEVASTSQSDIQVADISADTVKTIDTVKKYGIKSATIIYENIVKTISVDMKYKTIVYFDDFGTKECKESYVGDTLQEAIMSDGRKSYKIDYRKKIAYSLGRANRGTETRYDWNNVAEEDKKSGKVKKAPNQIIAGRSCEVYTVNTGIASLTYGGWKNILFLSNVQSPGGKIFTKAISINTDSVPANKFIIPDNFLVK